MARRHLKYYVLLDNNDGKSNFTLYYVNVTRATPGNIHSRVYCIVLGEESLSRAPKKRYLYNMAGGRGRAVDFSLVCVLIKFDNDWNNTCVGTNCIRRRRRRPWQQCRNNNNNNKKLYQEKKNYALLYSFSIANLYCRVRLLRLFRYTRAKWPA